jgi:hypothetical protein
MSTNRLKNYILIHLLGAPDRTRTDTGRILSSAYGNQPITDEIKVSNFFHLLETPSGHP